MAAPSASATAGSRSLWALVGSTAASKVLVMGVSGVVGIITSRLIIQHFGTAAYAQYGLLTSFPSLLPFADLGIAAVVINVIAGASSVQTDDGVRRTIATAFRVLICAAGVICLVALGITVSGLWPTLLGNALLPGGSVAAALCLVTFALALPMTIGQRILVGLGRTSTQVASQAVVAPFMLLCVLAVVAVSAPAGSFLAVFSYVANALVSIICLVVVARVLGPQLGRAVRDVPRLRAVRGVPVFGVAWPMLIQMVALPLSMQTDRLLISHLTDGPELAQFNLASQLFGLVMQTIAASGVALWPVYAKARKDDRISSPIPPTLWFLAGGLVLGAIVATLSPVLADFVSDGRIVLDRWLVGAFVVFVGLQATKYPIGMYMTDKRGLTFQVLPILLSVPVNLGLSWWLITVLGPGGTVIGSAVTVLFCQIVPNLVYVQRDLARRRAAAARVA